MEVIKAGGCWANMWKLQILTNTTVFKEAQVSPDQLLAIYKL